MSKRIKKIGQLDSLRALAAFTVVIHHFLPEYDLGRFDYGLIGVDVFFVISGFLITAILLEQKEFVNNKFLIIKNFIIKRALRLFPAYYLFISLFFFLMTAFGLYVWDKGNGVYYYTYTQNILFFLEGMKGIQLNHLWTLAVEEQFYLFWPWVVIFISNKNLVRSLLIIIPLTVVFKVFSNVENLRMLTFAHFDTLGTGALIALLLKEKGEKYFLFLNRFKMKIIAGSLVVIYLGSLYSGPNLLTVPLILVLSGSLLLGCYFNFQGTAGRFLDLPKLKYLGKISYGLYLYHKPIPYLLKIFNRELYNPINNYILFFISIVLTVLISHLSYKIIEKPFLKWKSNYDL